MKKIRFEEINIDQLEEYGNIPFYYDTTEKYELEKVNKNILICLSLILILSLLLLVKN